MNASKFHWAVLRGTVFAACDLSLAAGLELVRHTGPSTIGIDTIYSSQGKIPEVFLRGAGVPEAYIQYMHSLIGQPIQFYTCFISYSTKDALFAERLHADLQAAGVRCWFASRDMKSGRKLHEQIDQAIYLHERVLLILSKDSIKSEWVRGEILKARERERTEDRRVLFPISLMPFEELKQWKFLDTDTGEDLAREVRSYYIPDFSKWETDHAIYREEFEKLLKSLQPQVGEVAAGGSE